MDNQRQYYLQLLMLELCAIVVGLSVGVLDTIFGKGLLYVSAIREAYPYFTIPFLGVAGLLIVFLYKRFGGDSQKGMGLVFDVGHDNRQAIPKRLIPLVILTTWLTHLFGGSAGREGVAVQIGATLATRFSRFQCFQQNSKELVLIGIAGGFGGLFQTPMAATFFALELLVIGKFSLHVLFPAFTAAFLASQTSHYLGLEKFSHPMSIGLTLDIQTIGKLLLAGFCFAFVGKMFAISLWYLKAKIGSFVKNPYLKIALGGIGLSLVLLLLYQGRYSGLGTNLIEASFTGQTIYNYDWLLKLLLTVMTITFGFQGGEVTPLFAIGASCGVIIAPFIGLPVLLLAALGYITVFAGATNTLLGPLLIMGEVFGFNNLPYAFIALTAASLFQLLPSIYQAQKHVLKNSKTN